REITCIQAHANQINTMEIAPNNQTLVSSSSDRTLPRLVLCEALASDHELTLTMGADSIRVPVPDGDAPLRDVVVWKDRVTALDAGDAASVWLSAQFGRALRLVYQAASQHRWLPVDKALHPSDEVSFADGYPLLLIGTASLADLNDRLGTPVTMQHFRPNVVVETEEPFVEDGWSAIQIGELRFELASRCARCIFTTVSPDTGEKCSDGEPLRTLRQYRTTEDDGKIMFGMNAIPRSAGSITVGDHVLPL
ncbi:MAG: MOSC domain-containing protein, partial [Pseudomonadota bacterium]